MNRINKILLIAAAVQIGLVAFIWSTKTNDEKVIAAAPLLKLDAADVTEITISEAPSDEKDDKELNTVTLGREGEGWVLVNKEGYPVLKEKADKILFDLLDIKVKDPIATKAVHHNKLNVSDTNYTRKVILKTKGKAITLFVGTGTGRNAHVRFDGEEKVYKAGGFSAWSLNTMTRSYVDKKFADTELDEIVDATVINSKGSITFAKKDGKWDFKDASSSSTAATTDGGVPEETVAVKTAQVANDGDETTAADPNAPVYDTAAIKGFVDKMSNFPMLEPVGKTVKPEYGLDKGAKVILNLLQEGKPVVREFVIGAKKDDTSYYCTSSDSEFIVTVAKYTSEQILEKAKSDFIKKEDDSKEPKPQLPGGLELPPGMKLPQGMQMPPGVNPGQ